MGKLNIQKQQARNGNFPVDHGDSLLSIVKGGGVRFQYIHIHTSHIDSCSSYLFIITLPILDISNSALPICSILIHYFPSVLLDISTEGKLIYIDLHTDIYSHIP